MDAKKNQSLNFFIGQSLFNPYKSVLKIFELLSGRCSTIFFQRQKQYHGVNGYPQNKPERASDIYNKSTERTEKR